MLDAHVAFGSNNFKQGDNLYVEMCVIGVNVWDASRSRSPMIFYTHMHNLIHVCQYIRVQIGVHMSVCI